MKKVYALSTVFALVATTASAAERTNITTGRNRVQAVGRARATIVAPASASFSSTATNVLSNGGESQISLSAKNTPSHLGEIYLSGPENRLVTVSIAADNPLNHNNSTKERVNNNQIAVLYNQRGEGKVKINRSEKQVNKNAEKMF